MQEKQRLPQRGLGFFQPWQSWNRQALGAELEQAWVCAHTSQDWDLGAPGFTPGASAVSGRAVSAPLGRGQHF